MVSSVTGGFGHLSNMYGTVAKSVEQGLQYGVSLLIPKSPVLLVVSGVAWYYGRCLAITYAPGILASHFIKVTEAFMNSVSIGRALGTAFTAPMFTPHILPYTVDFVGLLSYGFVTIIGNLAIKYLFKEADDSNTPPAEEKKAKSVD